MKLQHFKMKQVASNLPEGIYLVDKPSGITSFDVIRILRSKFKTRKMGHAGTLDPLASGLLIVGVGKSTKNLGGILKKRKEYNAEIFLGRQTDTGDIKGRVIEEKATKEYSKEKIEEALSSLVGENKFAVPAYSAVKISGKALYKYARNGETPKLPVRIMKVNKTQLKEYKHPFIKVAFEVESGVYIRVLAEELGSRLGTVATLSGLRRTSIGEFSVENALKLDDF